MLCDGDKVSEFSEFQSFVEDELSRLQHRLVTEHRRQVAKLVAAGSESHRKASDREAEDPSIDELSDVQLTPESKEAPRPDGTPPIINAFQTEALGSGQPHDVDEENLISPLTAVVEKDEIADAPGANAGPGTSSPSGSSHADKSIEYISLPGNADAPPDDEAPAPKRESVFGQGLRKSFQAPEDRVFCVVPARPRLSLLSNCDCNSEPDPLSHDRLADVLEIPTEVNIMQGSLDVVSDDGDDDTMVACMSDGIEANTMLRGVSGNSKVSENNNEARDEYKMGDTSPRVSFQIPEKGSKSIPASTGAARPLDDNRRSFMRTKTAEFMRSKRSITGSILGPGGSLNLGLDEHTPRLDKRMSHRQAAELVVAERRGSTRPGVAFGSESTDNDSKPKVTFRCSVMSLHGKDASDGGASDTVAEHRPMRMSVRAQSVPSSRRGSCQVTQPGTDCMFACLARRSIKDNAVEIDEDDFAARLRNHRGSTSSGQGVTFQGCDSQRSSGVRMSLSEDMHAGSLPLGESESNPDEEDYEVMPAWSTQFAARRQLTRRSCVVGPDANSEDKPGMTRAKTVMQNVFDEAEDSPETRESIADRALCIISPGSWVHVAWDMLGLVFVMWDAWFIPFLWFDPPRHWVTTTLAWLVRFYWTAAFCLVFGTGYINDQGEVEMRPGKVTKRYFMSWFSLDFFLVVMDWLEVLESLGIQSIGGSLRAFRILRLLRFVKAPYLWRFLTEQIRSEEVMLLATMVKIMFLCWIVMHFAACAWYGIGAADLADRSWLKVIDQTTTGSDRFIIDEDLSMRYIICFHWSLSKLSGETVINSENLLEKVFTCFVLFFFFMFSTMLVSKMTTTMTRLEIMSRKSTTQISQLRRYLGDQAISGKLSVRCQRNARHVMLEQKRNMPESSVELLKLISEPLMVELHFEVRSVLLLNHPFFDCFEEMNPAGIRKVCHIAVRLVTYSEGDVLFSEGEAPIHPSMYFLSGGTVRYKQESGEEPPDVILQLGEWLCEGVLWTQWSHHGTLRVESEHSRMFVVDAKKFQDICAPFGMLQLQRYAQAYVQALNFTERESHTDLGFDMEELLDMVFISFPELTFDESRDDGDDDDEHVEQEGVHHNMPPLLPNDNRTSEGLAIASSASLVSHDASDVPRRSRASPGQPTLTRILQAFGVKSKSKRMSQNTSSRGCERGSGYGAGGLARVREPSTYPPTSRHTRTTPVVLRAWRFVHLPWVAIMKCLQFFFPKRFSKGKNKRRTSAEGLQLRTGRTSKSRRPGSQISVSADALIADASRASVGGDARGPVAEN